MMQMVPRNKATKVDWSRLGFLQSFKLLKSNHPSAQSVQHRSAIELMPRSPILAWRSATALQAPKEEGESGRQRQFQLKCSWQTTNMKLVMDVDRERVAE